MQTPRTSGETGGGGTQVTGRLRSGGRIGVSGPLQSGTPRRREWETAET
ncbi:hypothetical protein [Heliomicrobium undosum]|nr:hypothetical protein [Heliomicrobium undosum]